MSARVLLFLCVVAAAPALAQGVNDVREENLRIARLAFQARVGVGDCYLREGKRQAAFAAWAEASKEFKAALDAFEETPEGFVRTTDGRLKRNLRAAPAAVKSATAVDLGLAWLAAHQDVDDDGKWDADRFMKHDPVDDQTNGAGAALHDVGVTGLATLAFLGAGFTDRGATPYAANVRMALRFLLTSQDKEGCFGPRESPQLMYNHAIATLAVCEAYALTENPRYRAPAQAGLAFLAKARNPDGAWRYGVRPGENDTSVTAWCVAALAAGQAAGLEVDGAALRGAQQWLDKVTDKETGRVGYALRGSASNRPAALGAAFPAVRSEAMTAAGMFTRMLLGEDPRRSEALKKGAALLAARPPEWNPDAGTIDFYYWYWGTLAMYRMGGGDWRTWNAALKDAILKHQHAVGSGARTGSWDPIGVWARSDGGRVYSTALMTISLEVYFRYAGVWGLR